MGGNITRSSDCIVLLTFLEASGQQSLRKMQEQTGIPFATIREYISPVVLVRKSWKEIEEMKKRRDSYEYYLSTIEKPDKEGCYINLSKFKYLQHYGSQYGYHVYFSEDKNRVFVHKIPEADYWSLV